MKRIAVLFVALCLLISGCGMNKQNSTEITYNQGVYSSGLWVSYSEINNLFLSQNGFESELLKITENCVSIGIDDVYIHIRPFCDSLYKSEYFPLMNSATSFSGDAFKLIIDSFHSKNIRVHAWINPYRVSASTADINSLNPQSPAYKWLKDENTENDENVCFFNGIYLNPASLEVQKLIIDGAREILKNYDVDGIHFDDYFYPTTDASFDSVSYEKYKSTTQKPLSLDDWRRANVNSLLNNCYSAIKFINDDVVFSISPAASVEKNYNEFYADVKAWIEGGYIDCIIPQLYFGFEHSQREFRFTNILENWKELIGDNHNIKLLIGLANYKIGTKNESDGEEWLLDDAIIARQAEICRQDGIVSGCVLFSYSSVFSNEEHNVNQLNKYMEFLQSIKENENG